MAVGGAAGAVGDVIGVGIGLDDGAAADVDGGEGAREVSRGWGGAAAAWEPDCAGGCGGFYDGAGFGWMAKRCRGAECASPGQTWPTS